MTTDVSIECSADSELGPPQHTSNDTVPHPESWVGLMRASAAKSWTLLGLVLVSCTVYLCLSSGISSSPDLRHPLVPAPVSLAFHPTLSAPSATASMQQPQVLLAGCAHDVQQYLQRDFDHFYQWGPALAGADELYHILIYTDINVDQTLGHLLAAQHNDSQRVTVLQGSVSPSQTRTEKIASCRNTILETIRARFSDAAYLLTVDLDDKFPTRARELLPSLHSLLYERDDWDAVSFLHHAPERVYDSYALRTVQHPFNGWGSHGGKAYRDEVRTVYSEQLAVDVTDQSGRMQLHPVLSAFNGFGIYRLNATRDCSYSGWDGQHQMDCEHVAFHQCMRDKHGARIRVAPIEVT